MILKFDTAVRRRRRQPTKRLSPIIAEIVVDLQRLEITHPTTVLTIQTFLKEKLGSISVYSDEGA